MAETRGQQNRPRAAVHGLAGGASDKHIAVCAQDLCKVYGTTVPVYALDHVSFEIAEGEMVAVMGPSGSGKSTLLNMVGALDRPTSGTVYIDGQDLATVRDIDRFRARTVGFVFQMHNLIPTLTALENVEVPMRGQGLGAGRRRARARELLATVGLADREGHLPSQLSGGERQRVAIARALANEPRLILADEPTGNLDSVSGQELIALLRALNRDQGATIVLVTHDSRVARATGRILNMMDGKIAREHIVGDPLIEDLRALAHSDLGARLIARDGAALQGLPLMRDGQLTATAEALAELLDELRA